MRSTLDRMTDDILIKLDKIQHLNEHEENICTSIIYSDNVTNIQSALQSLYSVDQDVISVRDLKIQTLIPCIHGHYNKLKETQITQIRKRISTTQQTFTNDETFQALKSNVTNMINDAIPVPYAIRNTKISNDNKPLLQEQHHL